MERGPEQPALSHLPSLLQRWWVNSFGLIAIPPVHPEPFGWLKTGLSKGRPSTDSRVAHQYKQIPHSSGNMLVRTRYVM